MIPPIARRFVAGESPNGAIEHAKTINKRDVGAIVNVLGEHYTDPTQAEQDAEEYLELLEIIDGCENRICISVKPSQIGLDIDDTAFMNNLERIVDVAASQDTFVWIDMEDHTTTDVTLDAFETLTVKHGGGVGVCVQANLKRTATDLERLASLPGKIRLVKGAYDEPATVAYRDKARVNEEYRDLMSFMFESFRSGIAIGSHDPEMIDLASDLHRTYGTEFELQMLMGVRDDAQYELALENDVFQYVPYGDRWLSYFYRRAMERKENALFAARAILGR